MTNIDVYQQVSEDASIVVLEKAHGATTVDDIAEALEEYERLFKAGIASAGEILTPGSSPPHNH